MVRPTVNSTKHYVQFSLQSVLASAIKDLPISAAVSAPSSNLEAEVREGSVIKAVYLEMWIRGSELSPGSVLVTFYKRSGGDASLSTTEAASLFTYDNKKNIFYHTQGLTNDTDADAIPFIRQWFKIPRGKQRMGLNDKLSLSIFAQGAVDQVICGFATYKEYF